MSLFLKKLYCKMVVILNYLQDPRNVKVLYISKPITVACILTISPRVMQPLTNKQKQSKQF